MSVRYSTNKTIGIPIPKVVLKKTNITNLYIEESTAIFLDQVELYLKGPTIFSDVYCHSDNVDTCAILFMLTGDYLQFSNYIEFLQCVATYAIVASEIHITEYSTINFTANNITVVHTDMSDSDTTSMLTSMMLKPCVFQYTSNRGNLDNEFLMGKHLNYLILFKSNNIEYIELNKYSILHCGWNQYAAFIKSNPRFVNQKVITYVNDSLENQKIVKDICLCDNKDSHQDCYRDELGPFYPGQMIDFYFLITIVPFLFEDLLIKIEDGPESACSSRNKSVLTELHRNKCTIVKYTILHKTSQECDLYLKAVPMYKLGYSVSLDLVMIEMYYIKLSACPLGFILKDKFCQCDPILRSTVTTCDINDQTVMRHANSWISGLTVNNSHNYNVSMQCPFDYCLPYASHLNLFNPNSQCQFKRTGVLCGQCQHGLSVVFGSSECQHCSNVYLLIIIPIGIAGILLVLLLFTLNLTVTGGDINAILLYVNIISINTPIFLPDHKRYECTYISLANLDLGITTCFYNGMDDYAKMWLQLVFPLYLIVIAIIFIFASRHSTRVLRLTANKALPVLATLFLLSYTKVLRTVSNTLFLYPKITQLPSGHSTLVWGVDTNIPVFGAKFLVLFCVCLLLFMVLALFNSVLLFTRPLSCFKLVSHFKPLLDAYHGPYKDTFYYWTGLQLVLRAVFFSLTALERKTNLMISALLIGMVACIQGTLCPLKNKTQNVQELFLLLNLHALFVLTLYSDSNRIAITILISLSTLQLFIIVLKSTTLGRKCYTQLNFILTTITEKILKYFKKSATVANVRLNIPLVPDVTYNYKEFREPLIGKDN